MDPIKMLSQLLQFIRLRTDTRESGLQSDDFPEKFRPLITILYEAINRCIVLRSTRKVGNVASPGAVQPTNDIDRQSNVRPRRHSKGSGSAV